MYKYSDTLNCSNFRYSFRKDSNLLMFNGNLIRFAKWEHGSKYIVVIHFAKDKKTVSAL